MNTNLNNKVCEAANSNGDKTDNDTPEDVGDLAALEVIKPLEVHAGLHHGRVQLLALGTWVSILDR